MARDISPEERKCKHCDAPAVLKYERWLCLRHHRYLQMCAGAKRAGKTVPTFEQLDGMPGSNLICPDCTIKMEWNKSDEGVACVASLQHYRDGTLAIVCLSCNARHASMPGDEYRTTPPNHKKCPRCTEVKPFGMFYPDRSRQGPLKLSSACKECANESRTDWGKANRERHNEYQRKLYHARKVAV